MDTKKLRQKILDLAIHGKLVPQNPNDEPASVLLERIRAEKERLIAEGKIKRSKKSATSDTSHYENEVPFEVPDGWCWTTLQDISLLIEDCPHTTAPDEGSGYPLVRTPNIGEGYLILEGVHRVSEETYNKRNVRAVPQADDIVYAREAPAGNAAVIKKEEIICLGQRTVLIRPAKNYVDSNLLAYFILSPYSRNRLISKATGSTVQHVNMESIRPHLIPLPPYNEQLRIVDKIKVLLSLVDELAESEITIHHAVDQAKSKILDLAIHGKLVPQDANDEPASELLKRINPKAVASCDNPHYGILPENWCWVKLGQLFNIVSAKRVTKDQWKSVGVPFYRTREIVQLSQNGHVDNELFIDIEHYESLKNKYGIPQPGDIMLTAVGTIGKTYVVSQDDKFYYKDASVLCMQNVHDINSQYIELAFCSTLVQKQLYEKSKGTTVDTITIEKANNYIFPIPPIEEQNRIVAKVNDLFSQLDMIEKSLQA